MYAEGSIAVLPLRGPIFARRNSIIAFFGGTPLDEWTEQFESLMANSDVSAVVLDIDSPGGSVSGVAETAERMRAVMGNKPVVASSNFTCASAAYWIASQADQIVATTSSLTGSVGVIAIHENLAAALEAEGVDVTIISAGKYKAEANPYEELGNEARAELQRTVDSYYDKFVADVASGRGLPRATVRNGFGEGRAVTAERAKEQDLVDRVESLQATIARLQTSQGRTAALKRRARAEDDFPITRKVEPPEPLVERPVATNGTAATQHSEDIAERAVRRMEERNHV